MKRIATLCIAALAICSLLTPRAEAISKFKNAFQEKYVEKSDNEELAAAFKKATCNTCHIPKEKKDQRNPYGEELAKFVKGADQRIKDARKEGGSEAADAVLAEILKDLDKAFDAVAKMEGPDGVTYGDRIKAGKLPVDVE